MFNLCPHAAKLLIKGPNETVVMGDTVALDCMYSDSELNVSQVHFEVFYEVSTGEQEEAVHYELPLASHAYENKRKA